MALPWWYFNILIVGHWISVTEMLIHQCWLIIKVKICKMGKRKWISRSVGRFIYLKYLTNIVSQANGGIEQAVLDAYCWMYSTWNIPQVSMKFTNWRVGRKRLGDVKLKVDFQEYKGACTGGDQVLDNMLNQGQSGTDSQVSKIFKKSTFF